VRWTCSFHSCPLTLKETEFKHMQTHCSDWRQNCILLCMLKFVFLFVRMVVLLFFKQWKLKNVIFPFFFFFFFFKMLTSYCCISPTLSLPFSLSYLNHVCYCCDDNCWIAGSLRLRCISPSVCGILGTVRHAQYVNVCVSENETKLVDKPPPPPCVCENDNFMCACYCLS
jgi:hypothetical protein